MMPFEQFLSDHLRSKMLARRALTVFDPAGRLREVARALADEYCRLIEVGDDIIAAREQALTALAELGSDRSNASHLVVYVPKPRPLDQDAVCLDPFTPVALAGAVFPDGAGDSYVALCQRFLPEQAGVVEEMFQRGEPTFLEINSLAAGADSAPVLAGLLGAHGTQDLFVRLLCITPKDAALLKQSPNWRQELQSLALNALGLTLPTDLTGVDELRPVLWRYLLFSEFVADLPVPLPAALGHVPHAASKHHRFVRDLCATLRDRSSAQQAYEDFAARVAAELGLETHCGSLDDLGVLDTFAFEERSFLRAFATHVKSGDLDRATQCVEARSQSFWMRDGERASEWRLADSCLQVLRSIEDVDQILAGTTRQTVPHWLDFHVAHGYRLDAAHRLMEQVAQDVRPEASPLGQVLVQTRTRHRELVDRLTRKFQDAVGREGWPAGGRLRSSDIFDRFVRVPWQEGKRVAYFWVDAFRYDLAVTLAEAVAGRHAATLHAACAQLPTVTKVGMAALLPGAAEGLRLERLSDEVVPTINGRSLPGLPQRIEHAREAIGTNRFAALELSDVLRSGGLASLDHVEVLVVRTSEIDQIGESNPAYLPQLLPAAIRDLRLALNVLADAGFTVAVLATDHGFCWFDSVESGDAIQKPSGEWLAVKNRALLGSGQPGPQVFTADASHVGIRGDIPQYVAARGMATFTKGVRYFHEGLSLQECVLPVLQVALTPTARDGAPSRVELLLTYRGAKAGTVTTLRPSIEASLPLGDLFRPSDVSFVLEGYDAAGTKVAEAAASPLVDAATREVRMQPGQSLKVPIRITEGFSGTIEVRATHPGTGELFATVTLTTDFHH
jgi:hypothetical protein